MKCKPPIKQTETWKDQILQITKCFNKGEKGICQERNLYLLWEELS